MSLLAYSRQSLNFNGPLRERESSKISHELLTSNKLVPNVFRKHLLRVCLMAAQLGGPLPT